MKFRLLLFILAVKLRATAALSAGFRKRLRGKDMVLVIRTGREDQARTYHIAGGRVRSAAGRDPSAATELVWCDPDTAVRTMLSKDELDGFSAIGRGQLRILGNFENALRFLDLAG
ncbi:MAG: hypothetical protein JXA20_16010 [Spirochaetes bacterium]|nr:hypothetical protein [Spirochaetota bacterium]